LKEINNDSFSSRIFKEYLKALQDINVVLTTGLQTALAVLTNFERLTEEQR
jgi:hypothetical protein